MRVRLWPRLIFLAVVLFTSPRAVLAQAGFDDDRVLLQGFYWESYRHGHPRFPQYGTKKWYEIVRANAGALREGRFDLVWLPPPCWAGELSAGYNPKQYWKFANSYGDEKQHRALLEELLKNGIEPVADLVLNHRDGETGWADFKNPDWGPWAICRSDEAFTNKASPLFGTPENQRGAEEERPTEYAAARVVGSKGDLYVRVGGKDGDWQPSDSGYKDYREYARGAGWKVWVGLPGNPELRQAPRREALPVPTYRPAAEVDVPDEWLD